MILGEFFAECGLLYESRKSVYRDAWAKMTAPELASGIRLKAGRVCAMLETCGGCDALNDCAQTEKILDDVRDLAVYAALLYMKLRGEKK